MATSVNVVMVARDRHALTEQAVTSLMEHTPTGAATLLLVDDCSEPELHLKHFAAWDLPRNIYWRLDSSSHNLGDLKTRAVMDSKQAFGRAEWLCLIDNDAYFKEGWLETMEHLATASEPLGFALWGGVNHPWHMTPQHAHPVPELPGLTESYTLSGTHMFMRWQTWDRFGPMHSDAPGVCKMEDVYFCQRVKAAGLRIGIADPPVVIDCGLTQTGGTPGPGADERRKQMVPGVLYV